MQINFNNSDLFIDNNLKTMNKIDRKNNNNSNNLSSMSDFVNLKEIRKLNIRKEFVDNYINKRRSKEINKVENNNKDNDNSNEEWPYSLESDLIYFKEINSKISGFSLKNIQYLIKYLTDLLKIFIEIPLTQMYFQNSLCRLLEDSSTNKSNFVISIFNLHWKWTDFEIIILSYKLIIRLSEFNKSILQKFLDINAGDKICENITYSKTRKNSLELCYNIFTVTNYDEKFSDNFIIHFNKLIMKIDQIGIYEDINDFFNKIRSNKGNLTLVTKKESYIKNLKFKEEIFILIEEIKINCYRISYANDIIFNIFSSIDLIIEDESLLVLILYFADFLIKKIKDKLEVFSIDLYYKISNCKVKFLEVANNISPSMKDNLDLLINRLDNFQLN